MGPYGYNHDHKRLTLDPILGKMKGTMKEMCYEFVVQHERDRLQFLVA